MKHKVRAKVLRKHKCYFCDKTTKERHHIIPRRIGGSGMSKNKKYVCKKCHPKLHKLLDPVIDYLLIYIGQLQKTEAPPKMRKIGFMRGNGKRGGLPEPLKEDNRPL